MEENPTIDNFTAPADKREMKLNEEDKFNLVSGAKWAEFLSIVMFVCIGLVVAVCVLVMLGALFAGVSANDFGSPYGSIGHLQTAMMAPIMFAYAVIYLIYLIPAVYLYRFARKTKSAVAAGNEVEMTEAFRNLRGSLKVSGIMVIVGIVLAFLMVIAMIIMAAAGVL